MKKKKVKYPFKKRCSMYCEGCDKTYYRIVSIAKRSYRVINPYCGKCGTELEREIEKEEY